MIIIVWCPNMEIILNHLENIFQAFNKLLIPLVKNRISMKLSNCSSEKYQVLYVSTFFVPT